MISCTVSTDTNSHWIKSTTLLLLALALASCALHNASDNFKFEETSTVTDPYLWLEDIDSERALSWVHAENETSLARLKSHPDYDTLYAQALDVYTSKDRLITGQPRDGFMYNYWQDVANPQGIWRRASMESYLSGRPEWTILFDLDAYNKAHTGEDPNINWVWHGVVCLPNSSRCLLKLSYGGKDADVVSEYDLDTRDFVPDGFYLPEAKQEVAWLHKDALAVTTPKGENSVTDSGYPRSVTLWTRGTTLADGVTLLEIDDTETGVFVAQYDTTEGIRTAAVRARTFFEVETYHIAPDGTLTLLPAPLLAEPKGFHKEQVIVALNENWEIETQTGIQSLKAGSLISYDLAEAQSGPLSVVHSIYEPDEKSAFQDAVSSSGAVYVSVSENVASKVYRAVFTGSGWNLTTVDLPANGSVAFRGVSSETDQIFYQYENFLIPDSLYSQENGKSPQQISSLPQWFDTNGLAISQRETISADGTTVPYFLVHREDIPLDRTTPTLLYGYGGFQISYQPFYSGGIGRLWLERGGAYALANIRGGGEFGPAWHQAALKENRQRAFDDFIAVAGHLSSTGVTSPQHLGIQGGSNGGLLVGAVMVQRPDLFNAVVCQVPLLDMLRYHKLLAGASWVGEFGDPDIPEQRAYIEKYSPYQRLDPQADYPTAFVYTSTRDDRVHPGHARKFVARLKEQGHEVIYFERIEGGHSGGANLEQAAESVTLVYTYLWEQLAAKEATN